MTNNQDDAGEDALAGIDLRTWRVPPPSPIDRASLVARAASPPETRARRGRTVGLLAAVVLSAAAVTMLVLAGRTPSEPTASVQPTSSGTTTEAEHRGPPQQLERAAGGATKDACVRPDLLPSALPLMPCPERAAPAACTAGCGPNDQHVNLFYRGEPKALASAWRAALAADGWKASVRESSLDPDRAGEPRRKISIVEATKGGARVLTAVMTAPPPAAKGETLLALTFTPSTNRPTSGACTRPKLLPAALPLMDCPLRAAPGECTGPCNDAQRVILSYRGDPEVLASAWRETLDADGWKTKVRTSAARSVVIDASKSGARVQTVVAKASPAGDTTTLEIMFTPRPVVPGSWSSPVAGVAGRLWLEVDHGVGGCRFAARVELRSERTDAVRILDQAHATATLVTSTGEPVSTYEMMVASGPQPVPRWVALPAKGTLPVRIDWQTIGLPPKGAGTILLAVGATWTLAPGDYSLTTTVSFNPKRVSTGAGLPVSPPEGATAALSTWTQTLTLPPVRVTVTPDTVRQCEPSTPSQAARPAIAGSGAVCHPIVSRCGCAHQCATGLAQTSNGPWSVWHDSLDSASVQASLERWCFDDAGNGSPASVAPSRAKRCLDVFVEKQECSGGCGPTTAYLSCHAEGDRCTK